MPPVFLLKGAVSSVGGELCSYADPHKKQK